VKFEKNKSEMFKYPYQAFYSTKMYMFIKDTYYGYNGAITITRISFLEYLHTKGYIIYKIYSYDQGDSCNYDKITYFKNIEYIQRAWRKILLQKNKIKDHFKDQVARELMAYCYHPSRLSFQV
jgi:hypothetical protein